MNDFSDLEAELKQLRPAAPSPDLAKRIERALEQAPAGETRTAGVLPRPKVRVNWFALGLGLAAATAFLLLARTNVDRVPGADGPTVAANSPAPEAALQQPPNPATATRGFVAEGVTRVVYNRRDEGLTFPDDAEKPVRRVRSQSHETMQWRDPATGASLRVSYPTEEVEFIPVSGQ
jgi:hypothetical protein